MKLIDRYLIKELLDPLFFGVFTFTVIFLGSGILFNLVREAVKYGISAGAVIRLMLLNLPSVLVYTLPMGMLLASIITFTRLANDREIIALQCGGISFNRLILPTLAIGFIVSLLTLFFNESIVPQASRAAARLKGHYLARNIPKIKENINITQFEEGVLTRSISAKRLEGKSLNDVIIQEFEKGRPSRIIMAAKAEWMENGWTFKKGKIYQLSADGERMYLIKFEEEKLPLGRTLAELSYDIERKPEEMSFNELQKYIKIQKRRGLDTTYLEVQSNFKISLPFASLVFAGIGTTLGLRPIRSNPGVGLGLCLIVILFYYIIFSLSIAAGDAGRIHPFISAWIPNGVFAAAGILYTVKNSF